MRPRDLRTWQSRSADRAGTAKTSFVRRIDRAGGKLPHDACLYDAHCCAVQWQRRIANGKLEGVAVSVA